jgi:hypothetical protein
MPITLVGEGSVGISAVNSEHVTVGKIPIRVAQVPGLARTAVTIGNYAYWIGDEGVKVSSYAPGAAVVPLLASSPVTSASAKLRAALGNHAGSIPKVASYEQLSMLPTPGAPLTPSVLRDSFHHATLTARRLGAGAFELGVINLNTSSSIVWRSILETYNASPSVPASFSASKLSSASTGVANGIAASGSRKAAGSPYSDVSAFMNSSLLSSAITGTGGVTVAQFQSVMQGALATRSDTFRIRGYGDSVNPIQPSIVESTATCEAIVQRMPDSMPGNLGRRFRVVTFRWLLPSDL